MADSNKGHTVHSLSLCLPLKAEGKKTGPGESFLLKYALSQGSLRLTSLSVSSCLFRNLSLSMANSWQVVLDLTLILDVATLRGKLGRHSETSL